MLAIYYGYFKISTFSLFSFLENIPLNSVFCGRYNCGCGLAAVGEYDQAEVELVAAESQARQFLAEEGDSAEDIEQEVGIIRVNKFNILSRHFNYVLLLCQTNCTIHIRS